MKPTLPFSFGRAAFGAAIACALLPARADTAHDMMEKNFYVSKIGAMKSQMTMNLVAPDGKQRVRKMDTVSQLQKNGIDSSLVVRFQHPQDIKGTAFLEVEHADGDDDLWIYLPALQKVRRLVANNKKDSFMGSDFSYGEMLPPRVDAWRHTQIRSEAVEGQECVLIESVPASDKVREDSGYSKKLSWLRKDNALEAKVEYYDLAGKLLKVQHARQPKLVEPDKGRWLAQSREMVNVQTGHKTLISLDTIDTASSVTPQMFSTRALEVR
ncbi:outer membrane lipoprotein-sorting protein [Massilia pseudoviolaceinigra]|uniref:outer membrane lipoprotein-sorting protein n=1 Tax=Massilia pseudoviolaceinigra TaxID=3057165 RepID=UPI002796BED5|nr:outer membrane lipoprotein-sorting protein [Massilia sp. CCM 9206]MDQ1919276.1 outer membrane lipoprotein-sorting protein [Massilia sp. CCM 9206]